MPNHARLTLPSARSDTDTPEGQVEAALIRQELREALKELTEDQKNVIALRFGYEMPIKEVAETMGKSEGSIKMLQARAVMTLARILGKR